MSTSKTVHHDAERLLKRSWLVQRLSPPRGFSNPFSFGGGLRNGGLSEEAMTLLGSVFSFEYMGSAGFEFGAVPKALQSMALQASSFTASSLTIPLAQVEKSWSDRSRVEPSGDATVYILCHQDDLEVVELRILAWAAGDRDPDFSTKDRVGLSDVLRPGNYIPETAGWLELNNGFMFFIDRLMWVNTATLFGVNTTEVPA